MGSNLNTVLTEAQKSNLYHIGSFTQDFLSKDIYSLSIEELSKIGLVLLPKKEIEQLIGNAIMEKLITKDEEILK